MLRTEASPRPKMTTVVVVTLLTLLFGIQPVSTDLYLPALPTLRHDLGASIGAAQLTLSALIICFGFGQLLCAPLADRFGRRPVLLAGLALYSLASGGAAAAFDIRTLIAWRSLQGAAMAAAVTYGLRGAVKRGAWFSLIGGTGMAVLSLSGAPKIWAILVPQYLYAIGHGFHQPCGQAGAVGPFPRKTGTAASLSGFVMTVTALAVGLWIGRTLVDTVYPLTFGIGAFSVAVSIVAWTLVQRHGEPAPAAPRLAATRLA